MPGVCRCELSGDSVGREDPEGEERRIEEGVSKKGVQDGEKDNEVSLNGVRSRVQEMSDAWIRAWYPDPVFEISKIHVKAQAIPF